MSEIETISIVMPVKDTAKYLAECLDSIIAQTYTDWELIAVNDRSVDESFTILQTYAKKDSRIKVYHSETPSLLPALRFGYEQSSGGVNSPNIEDVKAVAAPILHHRLVKNYRAEAEGYSMDNTIQELL